MNRSFFSAHRIEYAPAKVNLFLAITGKLPDGYHSICSLMQSVSLFDCLDVELVSRESTCISLHVSGDFPVSDKEDNLVVKAFRMFVGKTGEAMDIKVTLNKKIPTEAGLGGGSSDAAAMLRVLNSLSVRPLDFEQLTGLATQIGADVAFCLKGGTAVCTGKGEILSSVDDAVLRHFVILKGTEKVSTPAAYREIDKLNHIQENDNEEQLIEKVSSLAKIPLSDIESLHNDFEKVVYPILPQIREKRDLLLSLGAKVALMTGSGAAVFGLFDSSEKAQRALSQIPCWSVTAESYFETYKDR